MSSDAEWNITPAGLLADAGIKFRQNGRWLSPHLCHFCRGGDHGDKFTLAVHAIDGNFSCLRSSCGAAGSFWKLIESFGKDPRDYRGEQTSHVKPKRQKKKPFIYGR